MGLFGKHKRNKKEKRSIFDDTHTNKTQFNVIIDQDIKEHVQKCRPSAIMGHR